MPRGIKKPTASSLQASIEKQIAEIHDKESAIAKAKEEYDIKVKRLRNEITEGNAKLQKLRKEHTEFLENERRAALITLVFNGDLSSDEISTGITAIRELYTPDANHARAIRQLREIAERQQNSTISNLVNELGKRVQENPKMENGGLGGAPHAAEQKS